MYSVAKRAFQLVDRSRRRRFMLLGVLALLVSFLEMVAALLVSVVFGLVLNPESPVEVPAVGTLENLFPTLDRREMLMTFLVSFAVFYLVRSLVYVLQQHAMARVSQNTGVLLAGRLLDGYLSVPYEFHLRRNSAELIRNAHDNVAQIVSGVYQSTVIVLSEVAVTVALIGVLVATAPGSSLIAVLLFGVAVFATLRFIQPRLKSQGMNRQRAAMSALQHLQQGLGGVRDIKILGREESFGSHFRTARIRLAKAEYWRATLSAIPRAAIEAAFLLFIVAVLIVALMTGTLDETASTLGVFVYAGVRLQPSLQRIAEGLNRGRYAEAAVDDLHDDLELMTTWSHRRRDADKVHDPLPLSRDVVFEDVTYFYPGSSAPALEGVNVSLQRGQSVGVVGETGGGKTTFLDLLCGLLEPTSGRILIDGTDLVGRTRGWQRGLGVVHQSSFLIDDTILSNIVFGAREGEVDFGAVDLAVEVAQLRSFVTTLSDGLGTVIGERGVRLSGGQRQRIALARAIYRRPRLLILDEGTSALDNVTEARVVSEIQARLPDATVVMVAHRLSSIRHCDTVLFLKDGRLEGVGPYDLLLQRSDQFRALAGGRTG